LVNTPEAHSVKLTATGKLSTARPKSVVPEKYLKDGSALSILGMTVDEIQTFPTFEDLLRKVHPSKQAAAAEFGLRIADNRDKAKDAAKKSRDERRQKIESLEDTVQTLETKVVGLQNLLLQLVAKGLVSQGDIASLMS
jgi:polyhydroxyalkanoate synthesis regulator phasin